MKSMLPISPIWGELQIRSVMLRRISVYKEFKEEVYYENEKNFNIHASP